MGAARKQPTIYRLPVTPQRRGRPKLIDDEELSRLRIEIATEVLREVFDSLFNTDEMTAAELLGQLSDRIRKG